MTGFSRGKLWRVPLAKTRAGYVGKQIQFLAFESLPTDVAISPSGDLLLTCHSGHPDWGAGPAANGYLYKIRFDPAMPQPVAVWPASPIEVKVAFDRPVDADLQAAIQYGDFVWEGDRYEWIWPGYEVVKAAKAAPRRPLKVGDARVSSDGRTVTFTTAPHPNRTRYALHESWHDLKSNGFSGLQQHAGFPNRPSVLRLLNSFEGPNNWREHYGSRIRGYVHPPETGDYIFWLAADDYAEVWLSPSDDPNRKKRILRQTRWAPSRNWDQYPEQKSKPIRLEKGKRYYIETIHVEDTVDDNCAVGWTLPDGKHERPIPGNRLSAATVKPE